MSFIANKIGRLDRVCTESCVCIGFSANRKHPGFGRPGVQPTALHHLPKAMYYLASLNIPFLHLNALLVSHLECSGGILLTLGLALRLTGPVLSVTTLVSYIAAGPEALGSVHSCPGTFYTATPCTFPFASLIMLICAPDTAPWARSSRRS